MVDRTLVYPGAIPLDTDLLNTNKNLMIGLGFALQAILGGNTLIDGLACTPTSPASLQVQLAQGSIYSTANVDATAFGSLGSDTSHQILKQGITPLGTSLIPSTGNFAVPSTTGQSVVYLIQGEYQDVDGGSTVLPYYNASNPAVAFNGPANAGTSQNTVRQGKFVINVKAGVAATTGSQVTPTPDAGFTGLWVVTIANGATTITSGDIAKAPGAPFIGLKLPDISSSSGALLAANNLNDVASLATSLTNLGFSQSIGSNGWQKLPSGLIMQWGASTTVATATSVTFPIAFPNNLFNIQLCSLSGDLTNAAQNTNLSYFDQNTTGFEWGGVSGTGTVVSSPGSIAMNWFALGN
jgi:hypothetical protein